MFARLFVLIIVFVALGACRKKIVHDANIQGEIGSIWIKVDHSSLNQQHYRALAVYNGKLFFAGNSRNYADPVNSETGVFYMDSNEVIRFPEQPEYLDDPMMDALYVYENELYVGGKFRAIDQGQNFSSAFKYDNNENLIPLELDQISPYGAEVHDFNEIFGSLIIAGELQGPIGNSVYRYSNGSYSQYCASTFHPFETNVINNKLWIVGDFQKIAYAGNAAGSWTDVVYYTTAVNEDVFSIVEFEGSYFISTENGIHIYDITLDQWSEIDSPGDYESGGVDDFRPQFKVLDGTLYLLSDGVYKYFNNSWENIGNIRPLVWDIVNFNGNLYAGTNDGLFVFREL